MRLRRTNGFWLGLSIALMLLSGVVAYLVRSNCGGVELKDMRWEARSGMLLSAMLYKPASATAEHPAPAIVVGHGWWNNREMQRPVCIELARRGYVVVSIDMYGHGNSDYLKLANIAAGGTGMYDAVRLVADLPYVDKARIGVTGHSHGARAANFSVEIDNQAGQPLIAAVLLVDSNPIYTDGDGQYSNIYKGRHVGLIADQYDEFYFRTYNSSGDILTSPRQYIETPISQSFLHFGADPAGITDRRIAGEFYASNHAMRITYTPAETHPWGIISQTTIAFQIGFFQQVFGAPHPIAANSQVWQIMEAFTAIGLIGFVIFLITFAKALSGIPAGEDLKTAAWIKPAAPSIAQLAWCCGGLTFLAIFCSASYVVMSNVSWIQSRAFNNTSTIFNQGAVFFVAFWLAANGVMNLIVMTTSYYLFWRRHGMDLRASGVWPCWRKLLRSIWLATLVATAAYGIVFVLNYFLEADFRFWLIAVRAFTPDKLRSALLYLPFFIAYFVPNSIIVNCFTFFPSPSRAWLNTAALALFNALALIVLVAAQYSTFYVSGYTIKGFGGIFSIWLFPVIAYLAVSVVIARSIYGATQNPYLGGLINAAIVTMIAVTNTLTVIY